MNVVHNTTINTTVVVFSGERAQLHGKWDILATFSTPSSGNQDTLYKPDHVASLRVEILPKKYDEV